MPRSQIADDVSTYFRIGFDRICKGQSLMCEMARKSRSSVARRSAIRLLIVLLVSNATSAYCQESTSPDANSDSVLGKFERGVQPAPSKPAEPAPERHPSPNHNHESDDFAGGFADELAQIAMDVIAESGRLTMQRLDSSTDIALRRNDGDIMIPFVRYDFAHQNVSGSIFANTHRLELGYGPFALFLEDSVFHERAPSNTLTITRQLFLYRMSLSRTAEVDFGLGRSIVYGTQRTELNSVSLPVKLVVSENVALELRPTWADTMDDYEIALNWGRPYGSLKVGYRSLVAAGTSLNGPFAGFSLYY